MKTDIVQSLLRLLCCALILFPHSALAGSVVSIPGFAGTVSVRPPVVAAPAASAGAPGNAAMPIPGFYNKALLPTVRPNEVPIVLPGNNTGLDTSKGNQGIETTGNDDSGQVTVYQNQQGAIINWQTFNIGSSSSVYFNQQGNASWTALNRIWDANPSQIYGKLSADGKIYLVNQNGILFGPGSKVNVNSLIASALNIHDNDFLNNVLHFTLENYQNLSSPDPLAAVSNFGKINAVNGGYIFLMAPRVENFGTVDAPAGQVGLAAGTDILLSPPVQNDTTRSGYYIVVLDDFSKPKSNDPDFGRAVNQESGRLYADGGMGGMYGNNVDQWGVIRSVTAYQNNKGQVELRAANKITTGSSSSILLPPVNESVDPQTGQPRTINDTFDIQPNVFIGGLAPSPSASAGQVELRGTILAPAGVVTIIATNRVYLETGSSIDVSGIVADLPVPLITDLKLTSVELRDAPAQKDGVLQGDKITTSVTAGSAIGDLSQAILTRDRTAQERLIGGAMTKKADGSYSIQSGNIDISASSGDIIVKQGALLDFSGGAINYIGGLMNSTKLLSGTKIYDISNAPVNIQYDTVLGNYEKTYNRFGIRQSYSGLYYGGASPVKTYVQGYTQYGDAGTLTLRASSIVLDGQLNGSVTRGQNQNTWTLQGSFNNAQDYNDALALSKARGLEAPRAGTLNIGDAQSLKNDPLSISVLSETIPQTQLTMISDPLTGQATLLSAKTLNDARLGALNLTADLTIATAANASLVLQPGGSFSATARQIDHEGDIRTLGGSIKLFTVQNYTSEKNPNGLSTGTSYIPLDEKITLGTGSILDASGERIDNSGVGMTDTGSLRYGQTTGGSISIMDKTDNGSGVFMKSGAVLDVSGGYSIDQKNKITGGNAGILSIQGSNIQLDGDLRGYALADPSGKILGGAISIASKDVYVGSGSSAPPGAFVLAQNRLNDTGFTQITLNSINDLVVESNTAIGPSLVRLNNPLTGGSSAEIKEQPVIRLDSATSYMAGPSFFSAQAGAAFAGTGANFVGNLRPTDNSTSNLKVSDGAAIQTAPAGSSVVRIANDTQANPAAVTTRISLSGPQVTVQGTLESPGGNISIQATRLDLLVGDNASILTTGYNRPDPSSTPKGFGFNFQPVNGGNVVLSAFRDLTLAASALVDVSGSDIVHNTILWNGNFTTYNNASNPGSVSLSYGVNGGNLNRLGTITANHAQIEGLSGGSLKISKTDSTSGMAINSSDLNYYLAMGFDDLTFRSHNALIFGDTINNVSIGRKLTLDAPEITGAGNDVALNAPWVVLTNTYNPPAQLSSSTTGNSQLILSGQWIDVIGNMNLIGFKDVTLQAALDIRLSQALYDNNVVGGKVGSGNLSASGNLVLDAERIYPANYYSYKNGNNVIYPDIYSDYTIYANGQLTLRHTIQNTDTTGDRPIYSAGGNLTIEGLGGIDVESGVTLTAPLGTVTLNAPGKRIYLADGSIVSTAGNANINYGGIDPSNIWVIEDKANPQDLINNSVNFTNDSLPQKGITLNADEVIAREGSKIDVSGGGSVFAFKFQPGVEGSIDPLTKPGRYIVFKDSSFPMPGTAVYLAGGGGLSAGMYNLLPLDANNPQNARYAFLPGAYIIEKQSSTALPGPSSLSKNGYPLVVGYSAVSDTAIRSAQGQVYSIRSAQDVLTQEGHYVIQSLTSGDAGDIGISGRTTIIDGTLRAAALSGYRGGTIGLAATDIFVQSKAMSPLSADFRFDSTLDPALQGKLTVSADSLSGKGFSEVDLGNGNTQSVTIRAGATIDASTITLTANQAVTVESDAKLGVLQAATGMSGTDRIYITTPGSLTIASGASVYASQGLTLDVNDVRDITGGLTSDSGSLTLKSAAIFFGADGGKTQTDVGLYLTKTLWDGFATFNNISLVSKNDIQFRTDFTGNSAFSAGRSLTLDAAQITGVNNGGTTVTLAAPTITLTNSGASSATGAIGNTGVFTVNADQINIGNGDVLLQGFSQVALNSKGDLTFRGSGSLTTGNANLLLSAARVTSSNTAKTANNSFGTTTTAVDAANFTVYTGANYYTEQNNPNPAGSITMTNSGGSMGTTSTPGGMLNFQGTSIDQGGLIQVDGGSIKLSATGGIILRSGSRILASGTPDAPGGSVALRADNGSIVMEPASLDATGAVLKPVSIIDVSAGSQGDAGIVTLQARNGGIAINGDLEGKAQGGAGGSLVLDTYQVSSVDSSMINTDMTQLIGTIAAGGFTESIDIRAFKGNIDIAPSQNLQARRVKLTADDATNGQINVYGNVIGTEGGSVELYAMNTLTIQSGGSVNATNSAAGSSGGSVLLSSAYAGIDPLQGWINVNGTIDVSGGKGGVGGAIYLRAQRNVNDVKINLVEQSLKGASSVYVEAAKTYTYASPSLSTSAYSTVWLNEAASYAATNTATGRLQPTAPTGASFQLLPGIEVVNTGGDITIDAPIELSLLGYDKNLGVLTVRAEGNLNINSNLTDYPAYAASGITITSLPSGRNSWGFNLVAGADPSSADYMSVNRKNTGNLNIADNVTVYTESAPIRFASGGDTIIGKADQNYYMMNYNLASFTGSIGGQVGRDLSIAGAIQTATGDINISVARDLNLLVGDDPSNAGAGAIRTTGQLSPGAASAAIGTNPLDPSVINPVTGLPLEGVTQSDIYGTYYWRYNNGGSINLSVGREAGKWSNQSGQWTTSDTGAWDHYSEIYVVIPSISSSSYGLFSADYINGTAGLATMGGGNLTVRTGGDFLAQAGTFGSGNLTIYSGGDIKGRFLNKDGMGEIHAMGNVGAFDPSARKNERVQIELFNSKMDVSAQGEIQIGAVLNPTLASDQIEAYRYANFIYSTYTQYTSINLNAVTDITLAGSSPYYNNVFNSRVYETILPATVRMTAGGDILLMNNFVMTSSPKGNLTLKAGGDVLGLSSNLSNPASILVSDIDPRNWYGLFSIFGNTRETTNQWLSYRTLNNHGLFNPADGTWSLTQPLHLGDDQPITVHADGDIKDLKLMFPKEAEVTAGNDIRDITYEGQNIDEKDVSLIRADGDIIMQYVKASTNSTSTSNLQPHDGLIQGGPGVFMVQAGGSIDLGSLKDGIQAVGNGNNIELSMEKSSLVILSGYGFDKSAADVTAFFDTIRTAGDNYAALMAQGKRDEAAQLLQTTRKDTIDPLLGAPTGAGDINMTSSQIATSIGQSDIFVIANGSLNLGQTALPIAGTANKTTGITTGGGGGINIFARKNVNVNESRVMTFYGGDITIWSDQGSVNAGRGSRTAVSAASPRRVKTPQGLYVSVFTPPAVGSGIRAVTYGANAPEPGNIHLFAPSGIIDAGEAGIAGGKITLAALQVNNASNINFSAGSVGLPQSSEGTASLGTLTGSTSATQNSQLTADASGLNSAKVQASQMVEDIIAKWLEVKVIDFVEDDDRTKEE